MKAGIHAIISKINEETEQHASERYAHIRDEADREVDGENALRRDESDKQREVLKKHNEHEYARRLEHQRSRLNRELLVYQHKLTGEIFDMAAAKLRNASDDEFSAIFRAAIKGLKGNYTLYPGALSKGRLNARAIEEATAENAELDITLSSESIPGKSGFLLRDDRIEYNCLFEDLVEELKTDRSAAIMKEIFGDSGDWMLT